MTTVGPKEHLCIQLYIRPFGLAAANKRVQISTSTRCIPILLQYSIVQVLLTSIKISNKISAFHNNNQLNPDNGLKSQQLVNNLLYCLL